ncbi:hypothetical protein V6N13_014412 [Hibiscus sabdariffa]|uniref:FBD domain-containing protein n=1 Tax=Hibiscus sabdariffa TaxID=183260 RepID=A0ABR2RV85_9ROSI
MSASPSLSSAVINIRSALCNSGTISVMELFQAISNVRRLELSALRSWVDKRYADSILQHSPHLKHLIFDADHPVYGQLALRPPEPVPTCLVSSLETIEIVAPGDLEHTDYVTEMILYLLQNGKACPAVKRKRQNGKEELPRTVKPDITKATHPACCGENTTQEN